MANKQVAWPERTDVVLLLLFLSVCFLLNRPYLGLRHDAVLYGLEALYRTGEYQFAKDLIISHGGQRYYSIYSELWGD